MRHCEACGREFKAQRRSRTCTYCGFNNDPRSPMPRSRGSLKQIEEQRRQRREEEDELCDYLGVDTN